VYFGAFFQDDWKVTSRLTLNLGFRYDLYTQPIDIRDRGGLFDIDKVRFALPGKDGYSRAIVDGDHNNIGPRAGFAYQLRRRIVLRGGYGIFYGLRDQNQEVTQIAGNNPNTPALIGRSFPANTFTGHCGCSAKVKRSRPSAPSPRRFTTSPTASANVAAFSLCSPRPPNRKGDHVLIDLRWLTYLLGRHTATPTPAR